MKLPITFHRVASIEFIEARAWYENKRAGLGREFISEIDRCVFLASENPCRFAFVYKDIRRLLVNRFPYGIYFRVEEERIVIMAVFHSSRNSSDWKARV